MPNPFNVGDVVVSHTFHENAITIGKPYTVESIKQEWVRVRGDNGHIGGYPYHWFKLHNPEDGVVYGPHIIVVFDEANNTVRHYGPFKNSKLAETEAKRLVGDEGWIISQLRSIKEIERGVKETGDA